MTLTTNRGYAVGQYSFEVQGMDPITVKSVEGGLPKGNTIEEQVGAHNEYIKHLSTVELDPISIEVQMQEAKPALLWIQQSWKRHYSRKNGTIKHADYNHQETFLHHFSNALLTEVTFPAFDATSKEGAYLKLKMQAETVKLEIAKGTPPKLSPQGGSSKLKLWSPSSFRFVLDGPKFSTPLMVNKIESFTVKQGVKAVAIGRHRFPEWEPTKITFPDVSVHMPLEGADKILDWYQTVIIQGAQDPTQQQTGAIEFLSPNRKDVVFRIKLAQVGIKALSIDKSEKQDQTKHIKVDMYVGAMDLDMDGVAFR